MTHCTGPNPGTGAQLKKPEPLRPNTEHQKAVSRCFCVCCCCCCVVRAVFLGGGGVGKGVANDPGIGPRCRPRCGNGSTNGSNTPTRLRNNIDIDVETVLCTTNPLDPSPPTIQPSNQGMQESNQQTKERIGASVLHVAISLPPPLPTHLG